MTSQRIARGGVELTSNGSEAERVESMPESDAHEQPLRPITYPSTVTPSSIPRTLLRGIDTLKLSFYGKLRNEVYEIKINSDCTWAGLKFRSKPLTSSIYDIQLSCESISIQLFRKPYLKNAPDLQIRLGAFTLANKGLTESYNLAVKLAKSLILGCIERPRVSRVDMYADIAYCRLLQIRDFESVVTLAHDKTWRTSRAGTNSISAGKGSIRASLYDKSIEIKESGKLWIRDLWAEQDEHCRYVVRAEFQLRSSCLKSRFRTGCMEELISNTQPIWHYLTHKWFTLREVAQQNVSRRPPTDLWRVVQETDFDVEFLEEICQVRHLSESSSYSAEQAAAAIAGMIRRVSKDNEIGLAEGFTLVNELIRSKLNIQSSKAISE